jgi:hypothetical protein
LAAGRGGHEVVLVERDTDAPAGDAAGVFEGWQRSGVAQFRQPHNFLGLGRRLLRDRAPDVYRELLGAGAVAAEDRDRARWWGGEPIDVTDPAASMALFPRVVVYRVAPADPRLPRAVVRRIDLLDPPDRLEQNRELHALALHLYRGAPRPAGPSRSQLVEALAA